MSFDYSKEWPKSEVQRVLDVLREVGVHRLGNLDGCLCSHFSIRNVNVSITCGKGGARGIKVGSGSMDYDNEEELRPIAEEVRRQCDHLHDGRGEFPITILAE